MVLIDFPHKERKSESVGFVTRVLREQGTGRELAAVYVPTTPNPTSGYLEIVPVERVTPTDWSVDEAMRFIISGGAARPNRSRSRRPMTTVRPEPFDCASGRLCASRRSRRTRSHASTSLRYARHERRSA